MSNGQDDMLEGGHVVTITHTTAGPGHIHSTPLGLAAAHFRGSTRAGVELAPALHQNSLLAHK